MNPEPKFSADDPRLTAYALGELDGDEHRAVEAWVQADAAARTAVAATQRFAAQLEGALADEPIAGAATEGEAPSAPVRPPAAMRFPWPLAVAAGLAAALAVGVMRQRVATIRLRGLEAEPSRVQSPISAPLGFDPRGTLSAAGTVAATTDLNGSAVDAVKLAPFEISNAQLKRSFTPAVALGVRLNNNPRDMPSAITVIDTHLNAMAARAEDASVAIPRVDDPGFIHDPHFSGDPKFVIYVADSVLKLDPGIFLPGQRPWPAGFAFDGPLRHYNVPDQKIGLRTESDLEWFEAVMESGQDRVPDSTPRFPSPEDASATLLGPRPRLDLMNVQGLFLDDGAAAGIPEGTK